MRYFNLLVTVLFTPLLFVSCDCSQDEKRASVKPPPRCDIEKNCVTIVSSWDVTGACEKPSSDAKAIGWFFRFAPTTPVDGDRYNFTLTYKKEVRDGPSNLLSSEEIRVEKPSVNQLTNAKFLIACRFASKSDVANVPQYVTIRPVCIGFGTSCTTAPTEIVVREARDSFAN